MSNAAQTDVAPSAGAGAREDRAGLALLCAMLVLNSATFRVVDPFAVTFDWQSLARLAVLALGCGYAVFHFRLALGRLTRFPMAWLLLYIAWAWLALPGAIALNYAAAACLTLTSSALFTAVLLERTSGESIVKAVVATLAALSAVCWIAQFAWPELTNVLEVLADIEPARWRLGGVMHANSLGAHCALAIGLLCVGRSVWKWPWRPIVLLTAYFSATMLATNSRTAVLTLGATLSFFAVRKAPVVLPLAGTALASAFLVGEWSGADWSRPLAFLSREGTTDELTSLTGRTELWAMALDSIAQSPVWGWGFGCSRFVLFMGPMSVPALHPHNMFLDTMIETGIIGGLIHLAMVLALVRRLITNPCPFPDMILLLVVVMGMTEVPVFNQLPEAFTLTWMLALGWQRGDSAAPVSPARLKVSKTVIPNLKPNIQTAPEVAT